MPEPFFFTKRTVLHGLVPIRSLECHRHGKRMRSHDQGAAKTGRPL